MLDAFGGGPAVLTRPAFPACVGEPAGESMEPRLRGFQSGNDLSELGLHFRIRDGTGVVEPAQRNRGGDGARITAGSVTTNFACRLASELVPAKTVNVPGSITRRIALS